MNYEWVKLYFETQFKDFAEGLGEITGTSERETRAHVAEEVTKLRQLIEDQRGAIERQEERLRNIESMFAKPEPSAVVDLRKRA